eukprot:760975-Rhodomonas_salina.4
MSKRSRAEWEGGRSGEKVPQILVLSDIGKDIDDSIALLLLARQAQIGRLQIAAVVAGGGSTRGRARCAKSLLDAALRTGPRAVLAPPVQPSVPCVAGADRPIDEKMRDDHVWTKAVVTDVTGGSGQSHSSEEEVLEDGVAAAQLIVDLCKTHGKDLKILCLGPCTDLAHAMRLDKDAVRSVGAVHFQGQCIVEDDTVRPDASAFNFRCDMHAANECVAGLL